MLEPDEGKLSRPVLRAGGESNLASLTQRHGETYRQATRPVPTQYGESHEACIALRVKRTLTYLA